MSQLQILVEGQSEQSFVKNVLAPFLETQGVYTRATIILTKRGSGGRDHRGGVLAWKQILENLNPLLENTSAWVTTLLDFYGLPEDVPGYADAFKLGDPVRQVEALEERMRNELQQHPRFIPFLTLHEFEAWLFSAPEVAAKHFGKSSMKTEMEKVVKKAGGVELINHGVNTHPKARLREMTRNKYKETSDGPTLAQKIGLKKIRDECPHFSGWVQTLENLGKCASAT
ncbi:DUF4276 family protein [Azospirillaceae bacterium]